MSYGNVLVTDALLEPLDLDAAKDQCSIERGEHAFDQWLEDAIKSARIMVERRLGRSLINTTFDLKLDSFPHYYDCPIYLPRSPLSSASITYTDSDGTSQTLATTVYKVLTSREPGEIHLKSGQSWPSVYDEEDVISIRYVAGYGAAASSVPEPLKSAMKVLIAHWHRNRESVLVGSISKEIELGFQSFLDAYSVGDEFHNYAISK